MLQFQVYSRCVEIIDLPNRWNSHQSFRQTRTKFPSFPLKHFNWFDWILIARYTSYYEYSLVYFFKALFRTLYMLLTVCSICYVHFRLRVVALSDIAIIILGVHHFIYGYMPNQIYWLKKPDNYYGRWCSGYIQRATISPLFSIKTKNSVCCLA